MRELFGARGDRDSRVWNRYTTNTYEQLSDREATVSSAGLYLGQTIVLEVQNDDGSWPRPRPRSVADPTPRPGPGRSLTRPRDLAQAGHRPDT